MSAAALEFGAFLALPPDARAALAESAVPARLEAGATLVREGDPADACYVLASGLLRAEVANTPLRRILSAPALVGEIALVGRSPRTATVIAEAPSEVLRIPDAAFRAALAAHEAFAREISAGAADLLASTFLRRDSPFADLPGDVLDALARRLRPASFAAGAFLVREGAADDDVYLIRRGRVEVLRVVDGGERRMGTVGPGGFVGETAALTAGPRTASVRALEAVDAYLLAAGDVRPLVRAYAALVDRFDDALLTRHRPRAAPHVTALPSPDEPGAMILRDELTATYLRVSADAYAVFRDLDGDRTLRDLVLRNFERTGRMDPPGVFRTVASLQAAGLATAPRVVGAERGRADRLTRLLDLVLAPRVELRSGDALGARLYALTAWLVGRVGIGLALGVGAVGAVVFVTEWRELSIDSFGLAGVAVAWAALFLAGLGHEVAHALACKAFGSRLGRAGIGLMWFSPVIYVDTTDTWTLDRRRRILVNAAGPLFNFGLAGLAALAARVVPDPAGDLLLWFAGMNFLSVAFNLSPLLEFDGYYVLSDVANAPMLRRRAMAFVFRDLVARPRLPRGRAEWGLVLFTLAAVAYVCVVTVFVMLTVPATVRALFGGRMDDPWLLPAGVVIAVAILALTVGPLVGEIVAAREPAVSDASPRRSAAS